MGHYISINCDIIESIVLNRIATASALAPGISVSSVELGDKERAVIQYNLKIPRKVHFVTEV